MVDFDTVVPFDQNLLEYQQADVKAFIPLSLLQEATLSEHRCRSKVIVCVLNIPNQQPLIADNRVALLPHGLNCPRHINGTDSYVDCKLICAQPGHAEINTLLKYLYRTAKVRSSQFRDDEYPMSFSHNKLITFFLDNPELKLPPTAKFYLWGHHACCGHCAQVLVAAGLREIYVDPSTEDESRKIARG